MLPFNYYSKLTRAFDYSMCRKHWELRNDPINGRIHKVLAIIQALPILGHIVSVGESYYGFRSLREKTQSEITNVAMKVLAASPPATVAQKSTETTDVHLGRLAIAYLEEGQVDTTDAMLHTANILSNNMPVLTTRGLIRSNMHFFDDTADIKLFTREDTGIVVVAKSEQQLLENGIVGFTLYTDSVTKLPPKQVNLATDLEQCLVKEVDGKPIRRSVIWYGHGSPETIDQKAHIAGLAPSDFRKTLDCLHDVGTDFLLLNTCFGGGENLGAIYGAKSGTIPMPILVQSSLDIPTNEKVGSLRTKGAMLDKVQNHLYGAQGNGSPTAKRPLTQSCVRNLFQESDFDVTAMPTLLLPTTKADIPKVAYTVFPHHSVLFLDDELSRRTLAGPSNTVDTNRSRLFFSRPVVKGTVRVWDKEASFLARGGNSQHLIQNVVAPNTSLTEILDGTLNHPTPPTIGSPPTLVGAEKAFCISRLVCKPNRDKAPIEFRDVVIARLKNQAHVYYRPTKDGNLYCMNYELTSQGYKLVSTNALESQNFYKELFADLAVCLPSSSQLEHSVGKREEQKDFYATLLQEFWSDGNIPREVKVYTAASHIENVFRKGLPVQTNLQLAIDELQDPKQTYLDAALRIATLANNQSAIDILLKAGAVKPVEQDAAVASKAADINSDTTVTPFSLRIAIQELLGLVLSDPPALKLSDKIPREFYDRYHSGFERILGEDSPFFYHFTCYQLISAIIAKRTRMGPALSVGAALRGLTLPKVTAELQKLYDFLFEKALECSNTDVMQAIRETGWIMPEPPKGERTQTVDATTVPEKTPNEIFESIETNANNLPYKLDPRIQPLMRTRYAMNRYKALAATGSKKDLDRALRLLNAGVPVDVTGVAPQVTLWTAVALDNRILVQSLSDLGVKQNVTSAACQTVLTEQLSKRDSQAILKLLQSGVKLNPEQLEKAVDIALEKSDLSLLQNLVATYKAKLPEHANICLEKALQSGEFGLASFLAARIPPPNNILITALRTGKCAAYILVEEAYGSKIAQTVKMADIREAIDIALSSREKRDFIDLLLERKLLSTEESEQLLHATTPIL